MIYTASNFWYGRVGEWAGQAANGKRHMFHNLSLWEGFPSPSIVILVSQRSESSGKQKKLARSTVDKVAPTEELQAGQAPQCESYASRVHRSLLILFPSGIICFP